MSQNDKLSRSMRIVLTISRLCLILSLWQAPVPWLHCHGSDMASVASATSTHERSYHLIRFHQSDDLETDASFGWHYHWVLPFWSRTFDQTSHEELPSQPCGTFDLVTVSPMLPAIDSHPLVFGVWTELSSRCATRSCQSEPSQAHSLQSTKFHESHIILRC